MEVNKIVITGGPCAGKTTAINRVREYFANKGYNVLVIAETATELINGGVSPKTCNSVTEYQTYQLLLQLKKEEIFEQAAQSMNCEKSLIVCDRGAIDSKSYISDSDFKAMLDYVGVNEQGLADNYDAVFHMQTSANGAEEFYTVANNSARTENAEEAALLDNRLAMIWSGHKYYRIIKSDISFENKVSKLIEEIEKYLKKYKEI